MTYKEKFEASQHKAHYKVIATKILREMSDLRSLAESSPIAPRRWVWELIQNAKDVHLDGEIKIKISYNPWEVNPFLKFQHTGKPFTADDIRYLIEQISTKERDKSDDGKSKTTGKFGTGFLTTHLLSEKVQVKGVAKEPELDYHIFEMELDRSGFELSDISEAVKKAKISVQNLDDSPIYQGYTLGGYNTEFHYNLDDTVSKKVADAGIQDLVKCLPFTLAFVDEIRAVEIDSENMIFETLQPTVTLAENIYSKSITIQGSLYNQQIVILKEGFTSIAVPVSIENNRVKLLPILDEVPRLFCDFPLVGTESFRFPVIINNPNFNPTDARDGIFLTNSERYNPNIEEN